MTIQRILITGCTRGIGRALALHLAQLGYGVYAVGRDASLLNELARLSTHILPIVADIATSEGRDRLYGQIEPHQPLSIIHNAALLVPGQFEAMAESVLLTHIDTNFVAPLLITQHLLPLLGDSQRVLHITSGLANHPTSGLMPYCATKAAMQIAMQCLNQELKGQGVYCSNLRPGMVDTAMQANLRQAPPDVLPSVQTYRDRFASGQLVSPEKVARFAAWVLLNTDNHTFGDTLWNIYDESHHAKWNTA